MPPKSKSRNVFICQQCGSEQPKWVGRCPDCGEWNTFVETVVSAPTPARAQAEAALLRGDGTGNRPTPITRVENNDFGRIQVPGEEFNRVLGGGIVPGSLVLIGGDPGIGKSTVLLQVSSELALYGDKPILYVSGEESAQQIKLRASRLGINPENLYLLSETNLEAVLVQIEALQPGLAIIDSIQTVFLPDLTSAAGSVSQVRECTSRLAQLAKSRNIPMFLVGHVTKEGAIAGPRVLEHMVDAVLYLEGDRFHQYRLLRGVKNRFGSTNEVGVFEMGNEGMIEVTNPSAAFLAERNSGALGTAIAVTLEGTRPILVEVQALTSPTSSGLPRRTANGIDINRLLLLTAVLTKRAGLGLSNQDIYVNVVGGLKITEPAIDLAVAVAIASSYKDQAVDPNLVLIGEVGLTGELRNVGQVERRLVEATKLGFTRAIYPPAHRKPKVPQGLQGNSFVTLQEAIAASFAKGEN
jgi:DNA repair protein RadA/Sms